MVKAIRADVIESDRWSGYVKPARARLDAFHQEPCPKCGMEYKILLTVWEDAETAVGILRRELVIRCPDHIEGYEIIDSKHPRLIPLTPPD